MIEKLEEFQFHDSSLIKLQIDFSDKTILFIIEKEFGKGYTNILFRDIKSLKFDEFSDYESFDDMDIVSADFEVIEENLYFGNIILMLGFSKPSWEISFNFRFVEIKQF